MHCKSKGNYTNKGDKGKLEIKEIQKLIKKHIHEILFILCEWDEQWFMLWETWEQVRNLMSFLMGI